MKLQHKNNPLKPKFQTVTVDKSKPVLMCYTDGGIVGNGKAVNKAAYAFIIVENNKIIHEYSRAVQNSTNNKCELQAIIECMQFLKENAPGIQAVIHSDSQYCVHGVTVWCHGWKKKGYKDVKNLDQWLELLKLKAEMPNVQYKWIRAHQEDESSPHAKYNNTVDRMCTEAYSKEPVRERGTEEREASVIAYKKEIWKPFISREEGAKLRAEMKEIHENSKPVDRVQELSDELKECQQLLVEVYKETLKNRPVMLRYKIEQYITKHKLTDK